jgi:hypothetical protein
MCNRLLIAAILCLAASTAATAQASKDAKFKILGTVIAQQAEARIAMPFGSDGFEITDSGAIDQQKVQQAIKKNGQSVEPGKIVQITAIDFADKQIEIELDGGGKNKKAWYDRIEVGMGSRTTPISKDDQSKAKGSKIVLKFASKVPEDISPELLRELLSPALDFDTRNFMKSGIDSLPQEFQEAVREKEARIGMDKSTVIMALGRADKHTWDSNDRGEKQETWIYYGRGKRATFLWFQNDVVVKIEAF